MTTRKFNQLLVSLGVTITLLTNAYPQASRTVMVQSNSGVLLFPTNLFTANAASARSGLSLATHATNPIVPVTSGGSGATNAATARTNFGLVWSGLTNSNAADFRSALELSASWLTNTNVTNFRTAVGLGATNTVQFNQVRAATIYANTFESVDYGSLFGVDSTNTINIQKALAFGSGTGPATRTNLGLGATWLTNTNVTNFRTEIGLGATNDVTFGRILVGSASSNRPSIGYPTSIGTNPVFHGFSWYGLYNNDLTYHHYATSVTNSPMFRVGETGLSINVPVTFSDAAPTRTNLGLGATNSVQFGALLISNAFSASSTNYSLSIGAPTTGFTGGGSAPGAVTFRANGTSVWSASSDGAFSFNGAIVHNGLTLVYGAGSFGSIVFSGIDAQTGAAVSRTNLGLPLPALTNTSNVTAMRALSGSTNTNHPFSGTVSVVGTNNTNTLTFSNGILQSVQ